MLTTLFENLVSPQNKKFWLVFNIPNDTEEPSRERLAQLARGELKGIKGVSSSREIVTEWFQSARNAILVMDAKKCIEMNDLQEIRYRDLDSLCENNFAILRRLFNQTGDSAYLNIMANVLHHISRELYPNNQYWSDEIRWQAAEKWHNDMANINSMKDLVNFIMRFISESPSHIKEYYQGADIPKAVQGALETMGRLYESESEWIVRSDIFRVPVGSILIIEQMGEVLAAAKNWEKSERKWLEPRQGYFRNLLQKEANIRDYHLADRYLIRRVDGMKFASLKWKAVSKRTRRQTGK